MGARSKMWSPGAASAYKFKLEKKRRPLSKGLPIFYKALEHWIPNHSKIMGGRHNFGISWNSTLGVLARAARG